jgi:hypothetical protein
MITDEIKVVCHSMFTSGGCDLTKFTVDMDGQYDPSGSMGGIHVNAYHEVGMLTYICESIDTIPLGKLDAGYHFLDYSLTATNLNCGSVTQYIDFLSVIRLIIPSRILKLFRNNQLQEKK